MIACSFSELKRAVASRVVGDVRSGAARKRIDVRRGLLFWETRVACWKHNQRSKMGKGLGVSEREWRTIA